MEAVKKFFYIFEIILKRYRESVHIIVPHAVFLLFILIYYRIVSFSTAASVVSVRYDLSFTEYLLLSGRGDIILFLAVASVLSIVTILSIKKNILPYIAAALFSLFLFSFFIFSLDFFRIYETPLHPAFFTGEIKTGLYEMTYSAIHEMSFQAAASFFSGIIFLTIMTIALIKYGKDETFTGDLIEYFLSEKNGNLFLPSLIVILLLIQISAQATGRTRPEIYKKYNIEIELTELPANPLLNFFGPETGYIYDDISIVREEEGAFSTASLENPGMVNYSWLAPRRKKYNIILFFFESTFERYLDIEIDGRKVTPVLNRLKREGITMNRHYANYPLSANAMYSAFTGDYGLFSNELMIQHYPDVKIPTLPEILKEHGYANMLIHTGGLAYAGQRDFLEGRDFDLILEYNDLKDIPPYNQQVGWGVDERAMIEPSLKFIEENSDSPFFISFHPINPHHPYAYPDVSYEIAGDPSRGEDFRERNRLSYLNSLHYADDALGKLLEVLEEKGALENTIVFIFGDHGEAFYQHPGNYNHPLFLYEENVHVPFIIYGPEVLRRSEEINSITSMVDISPTVLDLLGIEIPDTMKGRPILARRAEQLALLHTYWNNEFFAVRDCRWKYILATRTGREELYDLETDPGEHDNLVKKKPGIAERYKDFILKAREYYGSFHDDLLKKSGYRIE